jgi:hypothetical protein
MARFLPVREAGGVTSDAERWDFNENNNDDRRGHKILSDRSACERADATCHSLIATGS